MSETLGGGGVEPPAENDNLTHISFAPPPRSFITFPLLPSFTKTCVFKCQCYVCFAMG